MKTLPVIKVKGSPRERGRQQGEAARPQILRTLERYREVLPPAAKMTWKEVLREARKFLPYAEEGFPALVEELHGIAEGANVPFGEVWALNCYEELTNGWESRGCTSLAVRDDCTADGHVLMAHNEDWNSADRDSIYLVCAEPDDRPPFLGMTYGVLLVNIGLNAEGIGVAIDSAHPSDERVGVPRVLCSRAILSTRTIGEAIGACVPRLRAGGYNYLLADSHGELYCIETSATTHDVLYGDGDWLAHTNHYLSSKMQALEGAGLYVGSHVRLNRARQLLQSQVGAVSVESLQVLLRDHVNYPDSICAHEDPAAPPHERVMSMVSLIMDLTERVMWAAPGPPCEGEYVAYRLEEDVCI